jgi:hypothetical protein
MGTFAKNALAIAGSAALVVSLLVACGSSDDSTFGNGSGDDGGTPDPGPLSEGGKADGGDPYANDLPAPNCPAPNTAECCKSPNPPRPPIGGTQECPDDKNKPGCGCDTPDQTAACWTGSRAQRGHGVCKDGQTTCKQTSENTRVWGDCVGEVLATPGATKGPAACKCFSAGLWHLANLSPCFVASCGAGEASNCGPTNNQSCCGENLADPLLQGFYAESTIPDGAGGYKCPDFVANGSNPPAKPAGPWTTSDLTTDCAGHFKLCYELKAGDFKNPLPTDCSLTKVCTEGDYTTVNVDQPFGSLDSWVSPDSACAKQWATVGGYGEMSVVGISVACDPVDDGAGNSFVFNRIQYCPRKCQNGANATDPECASCKPDGSGKF